MNRSRSVLDVLGGKAGSPPPVWLMRQAGRYLPEYKALRKKAGSFLDLCYTPELAAEITLQPIRRFGFDAAILFSDILVVPHALGRDLRFEEGHGPLLEPITVGEIEALSVAGFHERLRPVYETVARVRSELPRETTLLGFCGAPWTVATYMIAGHGTPDQAPARLFGYRHAEAMDRLLGKLAEVSAEYLVRQIEAGADAVQIFDSWASGLPEAMFERWVVRPTKRIVARLRTIHPKALVIGFPRAATLAGYERYVRETGVDAVSLDSAVPMAWAAETLPVVSQGNLDPIALIAGGRALDEAVDAILAAMNGKPHVFNLGHGILPETPIAHVERMIARVRGTA